MTLKAPAKNQRFFFWGQMVKWLTPEEGKAGWLASLPDYLPYLLKGFYPWILFLPVGLVAVFRRFRERVPLNAARIEKDALRMLLYWFGIGIILFSLSSSKASRYLLPLYPPAALIVGYGLSKLTDPETRLASWKWAKIGIVGTLIVAAAGAAILLACAANPQGLAQLLRAKFIDSEPMNDMAVLTVIMGQTGPYLWAFSAIALAAPIAALCLLRRKTLQAIFCLVLPAVLQILIFTNVIAPLLDKFYSPKDFAQRARSHFDAQGNLYWCGHSFRPLHFYIGRNYRLWRSNIGGLSREMSPRDWAIIVTEEGKKADPQELADFEVREKAVSQYRYLYMVSPSAKKAPATLP